MSALIRSIRIPQDFQQVVTLWQTAGPGIHIGRSDSLEEVAKKMERDPDLFLVAEVDQRIVGTVMGGFDGRRGMMYHLAVNEEFRCQGIGAALMSELEQRLIEKGCLRYYLLVTPDNLDSIHFYQKRGWERLELEVYSKNLR